MDIRRQHMFIVLMLVVCFILALRHIDFYVILNNVVQAKPICDGHARADYVRRMCSKLHPELKYVQSYKSLAKFVQTYTLVEHRHKLTYTKLLKCGTSSMVTALSAAATGLDKKAMEKIWKGIHAIPEKYGIPPLSMSGLTPEQWLSYWKFSVVRHPFDRLYSAYREKFLKGTAWPQWALGPIRRYLHNVTYDSNGIPRLTFQQFVQLVADHGLMDDHWRPAFKHLALCRVNYDYFAKVETMDNDLKILLPKMGVDYFFHFNNATGYGVDGNTKKIVSDVHTDVETRLIHEMRKVPEMIYTRLRKLYDMDFTLFGYDWDFNDGMKCDYTDEKCC